MTIRWRRRQQRQVQPKVRSEKGLQEAKRARAAAEKKLAIEHETIVVPLHDVRRRNHVGRLLDDLITERAKEMGE